MKKDKIFVQIASYRDPELLPTLKDCISKAKHPENLVFSIAWQHSIDDTWDNLEEYFNDHRFKIIDIDYRDSKGACWARNKLQQMYSDEEYTLQLDSHHRFIENWDEECINMIKQLQSKGYEKPLLTGYIPSYDPNNDPNGRINEPWKMNFDRFIPEGAIFFLPATIDDWKTLTEPIPSRFYSAHFCFTLGQFVREVPHDPEYYFHGEEISIAVRAYTWGYDLFHPHKVLVWHEYTRKGRTKQWDDDPVWVDRNNRSHKKNRQLFGMDGEIKPFHFGIYDFGNHRTLHDYERYAGISFKNRSVTQHTLDNKLAPSPEKSDEEFYNSLVNIFKHCIDIGYNEIIKKLPSINESGEKVLDENGEEETYNIVVDLNDCDFLVVAFENDKGETIFRQDVDQRELITLINDPDGYCKIWRLFKTSEKITNWVVWPHSRTYDWCERITGKV